jgi:DNA-binding MarR family transcriptional regulator
MNKRHSKSASRVPVLEPADELDDAYRFFNEIGIVAQLSSNQMQRNMPHGLTLSQFSVLNWFVRVDDFATPGRLTRAFQVTKGAMTNTLGKLVGKGFVTIEPDPESGRRKIVRLTSAGRSARDEAIVASRSNLLELLAQFPIERVRSALPFLAEVRAYLDAARD